MSKRREDCPDLGHKLPNRKVNKLKDQEILNPVLTCNQMNAKQGLDSDCAVVYSFSDDRKYTKIAEKPLVFILD